jgi:hypothetical protein
LSCPRAKGIPPGKAGIHLQNKDAFVDSRFRLPRRRAGGNDKLGHYSRTLITKCQEGVFVNPDLLFYIILSKKIIIRGRKETLHF